MAPCTNDDSMFPNLHCMDRRSRFNFDVEPTSFEHATIFQRQTQLSCLFFNSPGLKCYIQIARIKVVQYEADWDNLRFRPAENTRSGEKQNVWTWHRQRCEARTEKGCFQFLRISIKLFSSLFSKSDCLWGQYYCHFKRKLRD